MCNRDQCVDKCGATRLQAVDKLQLCQWRAGESININICTSMSVFELQACWWYLMPMSFLVSVFLAHSADVHGGACCWNCRVSLQRSCKCISKLVRWPTLGLSETCVSSFMISYSLTIVIKPFARCSQWSSAGHNWYKLSWYFDNKWHNLVHYLLQHSFTYFLFQFNQSHSPTHSQ